MSWTSWSVGLGPGSCGPYERLAARLRDAKRLLDTADPHALLDALVGGRPACRSLLDGPVRLDHVGFVAPPGSGPLLAGAASAVGLPDEPLVVPSRLLARELARRAGVARIPTTLCRREGTAPSGARVAVEVFVPDAEAADAPAVEGWIAAGVGAHVAMEIGDGRRFLELAHRLPAAGLALPAFLDGGPRYSRDEDTSILFFELGRPGLPQWLEVRVRGDWTRRGAGEGTRRLGEGVGAARA